MAQTNKVNGRNKGAFKRNTSIGKNGEILYDAPIEIKDKKDLANYHITDDDCRYISFGTSEKIRVYFFKTTNREFAEEQWAYLNSEHSDGYYQSRCMVPGTYKDYVRCRDTNKCQECPYGITDETREPSIISWTGLIESGWEPGHEEGVDQAVMAEIEYSEIRARMDAVDPKIAIALEAKVVFEESVSEIALKLGVSEPRVYQLFNKAKKIGKEYRKENENV